MNHFFILTFLFLMYSGKKSLGMSRNNSSSGMYGGSAHFKSRAPLGNDPRTWSPSSKKTQSTGTIHSTIDQSHRD